MNIVQFIILFVHPKPPSSTDEETNTPKFKPLSPPTEKEDTINRRHRNWGF